MTEELTLAKLHRIVGGRDYALARIITTYQPGGGEGSRIFPPTFPLAPGDTSPYVEEERWRDGSAVRTVVLDQVPSQANRVEEALLLAQGAAEVKLPELRIVHREEVILTGLDLPHRVFDAYLRDTTFEGVKFDRTEMGRAFQSADLADATEILRYDPGTLAFGGWNSHRRGRQAKFPRLYASEIVGWNPVLGGRRAGRMDPLNLTGARAGDAADWTYLPVGTKGPKAASSKLSEIGHGNVAPSKAHGGVTVSSATRFATFSITALQRVRFGAMPAEVQRAARTLLAAYALLGDRLAFGGPGVWLRSGCDLAVVEETLEWVGRGGVVETFTLSPSSALALYEAARLQAEEAGVSLVLEPIELVPTASLAAAIDFSLTKAEAAED